jgi:hypothetical protein
MNNLNYFTLIFFAAFSFNSHANQVEKAKVLYEKGEKAAQIECLRKLKSSFVSIQSNGTKPNGATFPSRSPSEIIVSDSGVVAWIDGQGHLIASTAGSNVTINSHGACSSNKEEQKSVKQVAFEVFYFMTNFNDKDWLEAKKTCIAAGIAGMEPTTGGFPEMGPSKSGKGVK